MFQTIKGHREGTMTDERTDPKKYRLKRTAFTQPTLDYTTQTNIIFWRVGWWYYVALWFIPMGCYSTVYIGIFYKKLSWTQYLIQYAWRRMTKFKFFHYFELIISSVFIFFWLLLMMNKKLLLTSKFQS